MKITKKLMFKLRSILLSCASIETSDGTVLLYEGELEVGTEVFVENENGEVVPAPDGAYEAEGVTYVVEDGKIVEIRENQEGNEPEAETPADGGADGDNDNTPDPDSNIESEAEPEADPADEPETEEEESEADRLERLEGAVEEIREGIETLTNAIAALAERLGKVEDKIAALDEPAADPAEQGEETEEKFTSKLNYLRKNK